MPCGSMSKLAAASAAAAAELPSSDPTGKELESRAAA